MVLPGFLCCESSYSDRSFTAVFIWVDHSRGERPFAPTGFWLWQCG
ncbi:MAG: hypothetical protein F6K39_33105 [Okeania sp. SIO3B3]|nr:hypothetical protein [Okeania sp. SIO3B3]